MQFNFKVCGHNVTCTDTNIHIENSYQVKNKVDMQRFLEIILYKLDNKIEYKRSMNSWVTEWDAHNKLYRIGLFRTHTKDVDLNEDEKKDRISVYYLISRISSTYK